MRTKLVAIGNSRGVRLPKSVIEETGLEGDIEIEVRRDELVLRPVSSVREGWDEAFARMRSAGDDALLDADATGDDEFNRKEWTW